MDPAHPRFAAQGAGPTHTSEVHQFDEGDDDLCSRADCRGTLSDPIHCLIQRESGRHDGPCSGEKHAAAVARRRDTAERWSPLERRHNEFEDFRDYLDGQSIHCGTGLLLQARLFREDDFGEWTQRLDRGLRVRYELAWPPGKVDRVVVLHTQIDTYDFTRAAESWMGFRWPVRG
jgi:hypothetical protein